MITFPTVSFVFCETESTVPPCLTKLSNLKELHLSRNRLRGYVPISPEDLLENVDKLETKPDYIPMSEPIEPEPIDVDVNGQLQKPWTQRDFLIAESMAIEGKWLKPF